MFLNFDRTVKRANSGMINVAQPWHCRIKERRVGTLAIKTAVSLSCWKRPKRTADEMECIRVLSELTWNMHAYAHLAKQKPAYIWNSLTICSKETCLFTCCLPSVHANCESNSTFGHEEAAWDGPWADIQIELLHCRSIISCYAEPKIATSPGYRVEQKRPS